MTLLLWSLLFWLRVDGLLARNRLSQKAWPCHLVTSPGIPSKLLVFLLLLLAPGWTFSLRLYTSYFASCCEQMLEQKQFKEEMAYLGLLFEGTGTPCQQDSWWQSISPGSRERGMLVPSWLLSFHSGQSPSPCSGATDIKCGSSHLSEPQLAALLDDPRSDRVDYQDQLSGSWRVISTSAPRLTFPPFRTSLKHLPSLAHRRRHLLSFGISFDASVASSWAGFNFLCPSL